MHAHDSQPGSERSGVRTAPDSFGTVRSGLGFNQSWKTPDGNVSITSASSTFLAKLALRRIINQRSRFHAPLHVEIVSPSATSLALLSGRPRSPLCPQNPSPPSLSAVVQFTTGHTKTAEIHRWRSECMCCCDILSDESLSLSLYVSLSLPLSLSTSPSPPSPTQLPLHCSTIDRAFCLHQQINIRTKASAFEAARNKRIFRHFLLPSIDSVFTAKIDGQHPLLIDEDKFFSDTFLHSLG